MGPHPPRPRPLTAQPLDDGARNGTEHWRELGDVRFCHWDRWLLRLALTEPEGLASIAREFRRRASVRGETHPTAEALLAQVVDLEARLARLGVAPEAVLDEVERASTWLHDKAFRRVWHATSISRTPAMERTPRIVLHARAPRGSWMAFPVSPAKYAAELANVVGEGGTITDSPASPSGCSATRAIARSWTR